MTSRTLQLSPLVAGVWRLADWGWAPNERLRWIEENLALGISSFDHADIYGGYQVQALFGEALALAPGLRNRLQLVSKCGIKLALPARPEHRIHHYDTSAAHVRASVEASLRELRTDRLDLLLIHRPDALLDADELAATFEALRREGKVLHFGASNFTPAQFALLNDRIPLATNQVELSPLARDVLHDGTLDQCQQWRVRPMIWSPLARGQLFSGGGEAAQRVQAELRALSDELGVSPTTVAIAWVLRHPSRPWPIIGSRRIEASREALAALALRLPPEAWYRLWQAGAGHPVP